MRAEPIDEKAIFKVASRIDSADARQEYLDQVCGDQPELLQRVATLLRMQEESPSFLESPLVTCDPTLDGGPPPELPGTPIGPYRLIEEIGQGGMGVVYLAQQQEPVCRQVAVKIIKPGLDTRAFQARFRAEERALAVTDHPNIAQVYDAGTTASGRAYFGMELVRGVPVTDYCDAQQLDIRQRLELFVQICHGVQHAHQKGVIHRDLKPSNILVTLQDGAAVPKIIDFGIAKLLDPQWSADSLVTHDGQVIGTPLYMSPEQAGGDGLDIDTRSDIYSLGVLLYELLTGTTPFDRQQLQHAPLEEVRYVIRHQDPPRPSVRVSALGQAATTVSQQRQLDSVRLRAALRQELDWIVMKALEKDRARRYPTASDFAQDIERYLRDEPVEACPPSGWYRMRKFVRRNRVAMTAAATVVVGLVCLLLGTLLIFVNQRGVAQRRLQIQQRVNDALAEVVRLRESDSADTRADDARFIAAREQLQLAVGLAEGNPLDADLLGAVRRLSQELDQEQAARAQARRDRELLDVLEQAWRLQANVDVSESRFAREDSVPLLRKALQEYGISVGESPPVDVAARIAARPAAVQHHVLAALDEILALSRPMIGIRWQSDGDRTLIADILPDSPAARDGRLRRGDQLLGVGEGHAGEMTSTQSLPLPAVSDLLRGRSGTIVRLEVLSAGETEPRIYAIQRDPTGAWLTAVLELADRDPWRGRVRDASKLEDPEQQLQTLVDLAEHVDVRGQPVRALTQLAHRLVALGARDNATSLL